MKEDGLFGKSVNELTPTELQGRVTLRLQQYQQNPRSRRIREVAEADLLVLAGEALKRLHQQEELG